jgi:hypothetical protein
MRFAHLVDVDPDPGIIAEGDLVPIREQEPGREHRGKRVERPAQHSPASDLIGLGPQQCDQRCPSVAPSLNRQIRQQGKSLARFDLRRFAVSFDGRGPEEMNTNLFYWFSFFHGVMIPSRSRNALRLL